MENLGYLFAAYTVIWAIIFGYMHLMWRRQRRLYREIKSLKERLSKLDSN
jgi:CcmD family protein